MTEIRDTTGVIHDLVRQRAYEISQSSDAGTPDENWERALRELQAAAEPDDD